MNIQIGIIKITAISGIGSLNIGKTILAKNRVNAASADTGELDGNGGDVSISQPEPPTPPVPPVPPVSPVSPVSPTGP